MLQQLIKRTSCSHHSVVLYKNNIITLSRLKVYNIKHDAYNVFFNTVGNIMVSILSISILDNVVAATKSTQEKHLLSTPINVKYIWLSIIRCRSDLFFSGQRKSKK